MAVVLLLLSMCVIQMTSSQSTYDVTQQNDVISCERTEHTYSQLIASLKELQRDVAELKAANQPAVAKSKSNAKGKSNNSQRGYSVETNT